MVGPFNIVLIILDAAARSHFKIYGYFRDTTPFLSSLAKYSIIFYNAFCQGTDTLLSTTSLFTSLYPIRHNVLSLNHRLPSEAKTLAEMVKQRLEVTAAYVTIPHLAKELGFSRGFDHYFQLFLEPNFFPRRELTTEHYTPSVLKWLEENQKRSFFLYLHIWQPHEPYGAPRPFCLFYDPLYTGKVKEGSLKLLRGIDNGQIKIRKRSLQHLIALYDEGLRFADYQVRLVVEKLYHLDLLEKTIVIIASDHGEGFLQHKRMLHSSTVYEELIQIPLIIKLPTYSEAAKEKITALVESIDLMPTLLELLNIPYQEDSFDGKSLAPLIFTANKQHKEYIHSRSAGEKPLLCLRGRRYKYILRLYAGQKKNDFSQDELYDLRAERKNLIKIHPRVAMRLRKHLLEWMEEKSKGQYEPEKSQVEDKIKSQLKALGYLE